MKIHFTDIRWRDNDDAELFMDDMSVALEINTLVLDIDKKICVVNDTVIFPYYHYTHLTQGLERTEILYTTAQGYVNELAIFPSGKVALVHHTLRAPQYAINKAKNFCV